MDLNENGETPAGAQAYGSSSGAMHSLTLDRPFCFVVVSENEIPLMIGAGGERHAACRVAFVSQRGENKRVFLTV